MRTTQVLPACMLSLLVLASPGATERKSKNACTAIQVTAPGAAQPKRKATKKPTFSASSILDLKLEAALSPATKGQHQPEFRDPYPERTSLPEPFGGDGRSCGECRPAPARNPEAHRLRDPSRRGNYDRHQLAVRRVEGRGISRWRAYDRLHQASFIHDRALECSDGNPASVSHTDGVNLWFFPRKAEIAALTCAGLSVNRS